MNNPGFSPKFLIRFWLKPILLAFTLPRAEARGYLVKENIAHSFTLYLMLSKLLWYVRQNSMWLFSLKDNRTFIKLKDFYLDEGVFFFSK